MRITAVPDGGRVFRLLAITLVLSCFERAQSAETTPSRPFVGPLSSEYQAFLTQNRVGASSLQSEDGHPLGYKPAPFQLPALKRKASASPLQPLAIFPASFDLRTVSKVTAVRDQKGCGDCWAFSNIASLESGLMPSEVDDFSENNLKNFLGDACCLGGNHYDVAAYLAAWRGPVYEGSDPYNDTNCISPTGLAPVKLVTDIVFLPDRTGPLDNDTLKQALMTYGAVSTTIFWTSTAYRSDTFAFYGTTTSANHAVAIVGWDDNYDKSKFKTPPPGNGAFLCKNSWGAAWGDKGYFYISYYDGCVGKDNSCYPPPPASSPYSRLYQYDLYGWGGTVGFNNNTAWMANVFTAAASEKISGASWYTSGPNSTYEIRIYKNPPSNSPVSTQGPVTTQTGTIADAGYHVIGLTAPVSMTAGEKFSVVVKVTTPNDTHPVAMEQGGQATANRGESYVGSNGTSWWDMQDVVPGSNICLKALASPSTGPTPTATASPTASPSPTASATPSATPSPTPSATASPTPSATPSSTPSPTPSFTPSATPSPTPSPTPSTTASPTPSMTPSPTPSVTATEVPSPTPTSSPSPTATPEPTLSPTPSATPSPTSTSSPVPSPTPTASATPSPTSTPSPSPTASATPEPTPSPTPSVTPSPTPTSSPTPSTTPTLTPSPSPSSTPVPTVSPTPSATATPTPSPTPRKTPRPSATPTTTPTPSATISPTPTLTPSPSPSPTKTPRPPQDPYPAVSGWMVY